ncbi:Emp24/gp25L/p24 family protein [Ancylostoma duodenale]|uniref:Emp24/gp25L/p24 family protein n=1 Tax=Ancylostoma duodenale TaxID=51022 RepID=A0A0C2FDI0_9BILA|nr:Emp24/gp25L/p24 family protein [Ancylostoma duodenale]
MRKHSGMCRLKVWGEKGRTFRWIWRVSSGDVDFGIHKDGEMNTITLITPDTRSLQVYPTFRITTEFHPEIGSMECKETGDYTFFFDNSHGKVWSKDVSYKISLE